MARTHGWSGHPPRDEEEARRRIVEAAGACIERHGLAKTSMSDIATEAGVTRRTLYRYYAGLDELILDWGESATQEFAVRLVRHVRRIEDPAAILLEAVCFAIEQLPKSPYANDLVSSGRPDLLLSGLTAPRAILAGRSFLDQLFDDPAALFPGRELDEVVEIMLRTIASMLGNPSERPRSRRELRRFVAAWMLPALGCTLPDE